MIIILNFLIQYYMSIGVSVGGMNNFPDFTYFNDHYKPWEDFEPKVDMFIYYTQCIHNLYIIELYTIFFI